MKFNTKQLAQLLHVPLHKAYRLAKTLQFSKSRENHKLVYHFDASHPLSVSLKFLKNEQTKPIYSISEIASIWQWRNGSYSTERVRQLLSIHDIPIYNQSNKGYIYLSDLQKLLK